MPSLPVTGLSAQAVADLVGGRLLGDGEVRLHAVGPLETAGRDMLSLATSSRYAALLRASRAGAVLLPEALTSLSCGPAVRIVVPEPQVALLAVLEALYPASVPAAGIDPTARIGAGATLGVEVTIGPFVVVGRGAQIGARCRLFERVSIGDGVTVGEDTVIEPGAVCHAGSRIGRRVVVKANAVVGGRGFGFITGRDGHRPIPHVGACILEDDVQIGAGSCVDRGSIADTVIGQGTKLDNLVHVGHNVRIGARCLLMAGTGIGGSTRIGNDVVLAGQAGVIDNITLGDGVRVGAKSGVFGDIPAKTAVSGYPARPHRQVLRAQGALYRLAPIVDALERMAGERPRG